MTELRIVERMNCAQEVRVHVCRQTENCRSQSVADFPTRAEAVEWKGRYQKRVLDEVETALRNAGLTPYRTLRSGLAYMLDTTGHLAEDHPGDYDFANESAVLGAAYPMEQKETT